MFAWLLVIDECLDVVVSVMSGVSESVIVMKVMFVLCLC
jgi:hypothetical protein